MAQFNPSDDIHSPGAAPLIEEGPDQLPFGESFHPRMSEEWKSFAICAHGWTAQHQQQLFGGHATLKWSAIGVAIATVLVALIAGVGFFFPAPVGRVFTSVSAAAASVLSRYGLQVLLLALVGGLVGCFFALLRGMRDYENRIAYSSMMAVLVSANMALRSAAGIEKLRASLAAAQKDGVLSRKPAAPSTGTVQKLGVLARLLRAFLK